MNVQAMRPPIDTAPTQSVTGSPPRIGAPVPGTTGGLPAQSGLSVTSNPLSPTFQSQNQQQATALQNNPNYGSGMPSQANPQGQQFPANPQQTAQGLQQYGRGNDTMLVHMTPEEVNSLRGLAQRFGADLTTNPHTGLPEAGILGKLLPVIAGGLLAATGIGAPLAAGIVGLGSTALTGSLEKGLMAGLSAFGGASLAGAAGLGGAISNNAFGALGSKAGIFGANMGAGAASVAAPINGALTAGSMTAAPITTSAITPGMIMPTAAQQAAALGTSTAAAQAAQNAVTGAAPGFLGRFAQTASQGLPGGLATKAAPYLAATGLMQSVSDASQPKVVNTDGTIDNSYAGPYYSPQRKATFAPTTEELLSSSKERRYFSPGIPEVYNATGQLVQPGSGTAPGTPILQSFRNPSAKKGEPMYSSRYIPWMSAPEKEEQPFGMMGLGALGGMAGFDRYAKGGDIELADGAFVLDARTVSELGNGSSNAGKDMLRQLGGRPVEGPGDGVSDSVPARIGRDQPARVARDEVIMPPEAVQKMGGSKKLYALMDKAHKARKQAKRGQDTGLRKGLA